MNNLKYLDNINTLPTQWQDILSTQKDKIHQIDEQLNNISKTETIYPPRDQMWNALHKTPWDNTKVVILGQDPYHGESQANGLAFMVNHNCRFPPSLVNIIKELYLEYPDNILHDIRESLDLWSAQGVLLLNSSLAVIANRANSLANIGFQNITDHIISQISLQHDNCVFILWGNYAKAKAPLIDSSKHLILISVHPSPLSANRGFFGCNHFKLANQYLIKHNKIPVTWL